MKFVELFLHPTLSLLNNTTEPRISEEIRKMLQLSDQARTRDWYLYQNYIELIVYGCEFPPCKLQKFLPMRIFALEYIIQMLNADEVHFVCAKKKSQFKIKTQIGPFICNSRTTWEEANKLLKEMKFSLSFRWSYDLVGVISKLRVENKSKPYFHSHIPKIEKYMNQLEWTEGTLQEAEEQTMSTSTLQTPVT